MSLLMGFLLSLALSLPCLFCPCCYLVSLSWSVLLSPLWSMPLLVVTSTGCYLHLLFLHLCLSVLSLQVLQFPHSGLLHSWHCFARLQTFSLFLICMSLPVALSHSLAFTLPHVQLCPFVVGSLQIFWLERGAPVCWPGWVLVLRQLTPGLILSLCVLGVPVCWPCWVFLVVGLTLGPALS